MADGTKKFLTLDDIDVGGKRVVVRMDLNVPMAAGRVTDNTRIVRLLPTLKELIAKKARIIVMSHFGRPKGKFITDMSLAPLVDALAKVLPEAVIKFGVDCVGPEADASVASLQPGEILLLENLRFHAGEEKNDPVFAKALAAHGDIYINDAFSSSHRAHASVVGITEYLPAAAGRLMEDELNNIERYFGQVERPFAAVVGGAKVSTKLQLLESLIEKVDHLIIGGAMANTFAFAQGLPVGKSLCEQDLKETALRILEQAKQRGCTIHLPQDAIVADKFAAHAASDVTGMEEIPSDSMILDVGPESVNQFAEVLKGAKTLLWNGPLGAFETSPFDVSTVSLARVAAALTRKGALKSVAGGGDTVAAMTYSGLAERFSYLSTAGGAFLEWLEGKVLPGVAALEKR
ncbi:MAG TPA: phosphoglycerate kinase [Rickettsiales bacterium]|nr:phosphoglycerate kinase [Rickettsiales bacterium]